MRAVQYSSTGPAREVLRVVEVPDPVAGPGEVLVRIARSAVNPSDVKRRATVPGPEQPVSQIPHQDGSGRIEALGSGVVGLKVGDRVWLREAALDRPNGTAAEFVAVPRTLVHPLPEHVSDDAGALLGIPCLTAHAALQTLGGPDLSRLSGRTVLVTGAGGAVGHAAVQFSRLAGARTLALASDPERQALAEHAGAHLVIGRETPDLASALRDASPAGIDLVIDVAFLANVGRYSDALARGATVVAMSTDGSGDLPTRTLMHRNATVRFLLVYSLPAQITAAAIEGTEQLLAAGYVSLPVRHHTLDDVAAAHESVEARLVGRAVIALP